MPCNFIGRIYLFLPAPECNIGKYQYISWVSSEEIDASLFSHYVIAYRPGGK
jgi:hypothetical protein